MKPIGMLAAAGAICVMIAGCRSESERLADLAEKAVQAQAEQNLQTRKAPEQLAKLTEQIQEERKRLDVQFEQLESDRRLLNAERRSELAWAESFRLLGLVTAAAMPLFLCAYLVWTTGRQSDCHESVNEVLIQEISSAKPRLLAARNLPAIGYSDGEAEARQIGDESG